MQAKKVDPQLHKRIKKNSKYPTHPILFNQKKYSLP
jgi:hypothetical protein